ncbi:LOW QUALITY PROTEIN: hypothetical protein MSG28_000649 [Choristoneura fumiferana]|uniref:Uncharacterized protein n=1 Tax=Choristoneura fumiferana TaxID=7141 RepID=A0ACC0K1T9_CHOFU|nr:LOW QUALITY PROTEIN: hypothetical protein MSG28_000649 [Choristoneura fumiferana]
MMAIMQDRKSEEVPKEFLETGRTGRRNAMPDILHPPGAECTTADLPSRLQQLATTGAKCTTADLPSRLQQLSTTGEHSTRCRTSCSRQAPSAPRPTCPRACSSSCSRQAPSTPRPSCPRACSSSPSPTTGEHSQARAARHCSCQAPSAPRPTCPRACSSSCSRQAPSTPRPSCPRACSSSPPLVSTRRHVLPDTLLPPGADCTTIDLPSHLQQLSTTGEHSSTCRTSCPPGAKCTTADLPSHCSSSLPLVSTRKHALPDILLPPGAKCTTADLPSRLQQLATTGAKCTTADLPSRLQQLLLPPGAKYATAVLPSRLQQLPIPTTGTCCRTSAPARRRVHHGRPALAICSSSPPLVSTRKHALPDILLPPGAKCTTADLPSRLQQLSTTGEHSTRCRTSCSCQAPSAPRPTCPRDCSSSPPLVSTRKHALPDILLRQAPSAPRPTCPRDCSSSPPLVSTRKHALPDILLPPGAKCTTADLPSRLQQLLLPPGAKYATAVLPSRLQQLPIPHHWHVLPDTAPARRQVHHGRPALAPAAAPAPAKRQVRHGRPALAPAAAPHPPPLVSTRRHVLPDTLLPPGADCTTIDLASHLQQLSTTGTRCRTSCSRQAPSAPRPTCPRDCSSSPPLVSTRKHALPDILLPPGAKCTTADLPSRLQQLSTTGAKCTTADLPSRLQQLLLPPGAKYATAVLPSRLQQLPIPHHWHVLPDTLLPPGADCTTIDLPSHLQQLSTTGEHSTRCRTSCSRQAPSAPRPTCPRDCSSSPPLVSTRKHALPDILLPPGAKCTTADLPSRLQQLSTTGEHSTRCRTSCSRQAPSAPRPTCPRDCSSSPPLVSTRKHALPDILLPPGAKCTTADLPSRLQQLLLPPGASTPRPCPRACSSSPPPLVSTRHVLPDTAPPGAKCTTADLPSRLQQLLLPPGAKYATAVLPSRLQQLPIPHHWHVLPDTLLPPGADCTTIDLPSHLQQLPTTDTENPQPGSSKTELDINKEGDTSAKKDCS